ncbi:glutathione S-transferase [Fennellomyces sp. T-0311]|nr:glutathione S-transferase [Fennellomyces sp. T-0311]
MPKSHTNQNSQHNVSIIHSIQKPNLHGSHQSSSVYRIRLILAWKGIDYDRSIVRTKSEEQRTEEYAKVNPSKKVPTFVTAEGRRLTQTIAIMEYIEEAYANQRPCLPKDPFERALVREICNEITCDIHPLQNIGVGRDLFGNDKKRFDEWARVHIAKGFDGLESKLRDTKSHHLPGKYCVGDNVTMADFCLVPQFRNAISYKVDISRYPTMRSIYDSLTKLPEFQQAAPENQPDYEP